MENKLLIYKIIIKILRYSDNVNVLTTDEKKELLNEYAIANIIDELLEDNNYDKIDYLLSKIDINSIFLRKLKPEEIKEISNDNKDNDYYLELSTFIPVLSVKELYLLYKSLIIKNKEYVLK